MLHIPNDVQPILTQLYTELKGISPDFLAGLFITGSVVLDDFHPDKSDIDFVAVCSRLNDPNLQSTLTEIHKQIEFNHKIALNGVYITQDHLDVKYSHQNQIIRYQEGRVEEVAFDMAPIVLYELKTTGVSVHGRSIEELDIRIDIGEVRKFLFENINSYWNNWMEDHSSIFKKKLLLILFPRLTEWGVLGVARQFYTLKTGRIASKSSSGSFVLGHLSKQHHSIVREALSIRQNQNHSLAIRKSYSIKPSLNRANATLACMQEIISMFNREYGTTSEST